MADEGPIYAAIFSRLESDTELRTLLGKSSFPYGIYRDNFNPQSPSYPMITLEFFGGSLDDYSWRECGHITMALRVYAANDIEKIHARAAKVVSARNNPYSIDSIEVHSIELRNKGQEIWVEEHRVGVRMDHYMIRYTIYDQV